MIYLKDEMRRIVMDPDGIEGRWKKYVVKSLNVENDYDGYMENSLILGSAEEITGKEVKKAERIKSEKEGGLRGVSGDVLKQESWDMKQTTGLQVGGERGPYSSGLEVVYADWDVAWIA